MPKDRSGLVIGAACSAIVGSSVADLVNPIIGLFLGGIDFSGEYIVPGDGEYGSIVEAENAPEEPVGPGELDVLVEIRDALTK
ncbi:MscL family protein [Sedimentitalea nanhaiensis]|uniref:Large-conductance mechanosensitive channel n=1 Tax=Sedimentitalea nanhaiensis TaxID=999627 RepID=A0A1I6YXT8_9RHOB|nr:MscL family protein [Sedimentitalea nanhaiensis]SFT55285.1 Large-conductance mechanosensitive channel [Sedimentitalea nanhaiensis]